MEEDDSTPPYQLIPRMAIQETTFGKNRMDLHRVARRIPIKEFDLIGMPQSVKEFFDLFQSYKHIAVIWIDDDSFVYADTSHDVDTWIQECFKERPLFKLRWLVYYNNCACEALCICSRTDQNTFSCLDKLFQLSMKKDFSSSRLAFPEGIEEVEEEEPELCPLSCEILEKFIVQSQEAQCGFWSMIFTPSQCRTLATSGKKTHLFLANCRFQDDGLSFVDAYLFPGDQDLGPAKLTIMTHSPFGDHMLKACLNKLRALTLGSVMWDLSSELLRMVVSAELDYLSLWDWHHDDEELAPILINNIREGRGPKGLSLDFSFLDSQENWLNFCNALSYLNGHQHLKTLTLRDIPWGDAELGPEGETAFLAAWRNNLGLTSFDLRCSSVTETFWNAFLKLIPLQSSLRKLEFNGLFIKGCTETSKEPAEQLSEVILANGHIEQMETGPFAVENREVWKKRVIPALQHNEHRERFAAIEAIGDGHTRKAILAEALITVNDRPSLLYALLHRNLDVVEALRH